MDENENIEINNEEIYSNTITMNSDGSLYLNTNLVYDSNGFSYRRGPRGDSGSPQQITHIGDIAPANQGRSSIGSIDGSLIEPTRLNPFTVSMYKSLSTEDIVFLDMKIENKEDYVEITQTFIDKKNYKEIIKKYKCQNISASEELSAFNESSLNFKFESIYDKTEYRKDI